MQLSKFKRKKEKKKGNSGSSWSVST